MTEENAVFGGLIADTFKIFLSDPHVIAAVTGAMICMILIILAVKLFERRW